MDKKLYFGYDITDLTLVLMHEKHIKGCMYICSGYQNNFKFLMQILNICFLSGCDYKDILVFQEILIKHFTPTQIYTGYLILHYLFEMLPGEYEK